MAAKLASLILAAPRTILAVTLLVTAGFATQLPALQVDSDTRSFLAEHDDALANEELVENIFGRPSYAMVAIVRDDHPDGIYTPDTLALIDEMTAWLASRPEFETGTNADLRSLATVNRISGDGDDMVVAPFLEQLPTDAAGAAAVREAFEEDGLYIGSLTAASGDGAVLIARISSFGEQNRAATYVLLDEYLEAFRTAGRPERFELAGRAIVEGLFNLYIPSEGRRLMPAVLVGIAVLLGLAFRTPRAVALPLLLIVCTEVWMLGCLSLWGHPMYTVSSILPILIIAVSVADAIHLLAKYYDAQAEHPEADRDQIVRATLQEMTRPVFLTSLTTSVGFLSMTVSDLRPISDFGITMTFGIVAAFVLSIVSLPAALAILPLRPSPYRSAQNSSAKNSSAQNRIEGDRVGRGLSALSALGTRHRRATLFAAAVVVAISIGGWTQLSTDSSRVGQFRPNHHLRRADRLMNEKFAGATILDVVVDGRAPDSIKNPALLRRIDRYQALIEEDPVIGDTLSIAELLKRMNRVMHGDQPSQEAVPASKDLVAQYLLLYSISGDPGDFDDLVDYEYRYAHVLTFMRDSGTRAAEHIVERSREIWTQLLAEESDNDPTLGPLDVDAQVLLAGGAYNVHRLQYHIRTGQLASLAICIPSLVLLNWITFSSLRMGVLSVIPVVLSILVAYGGMGYLGVPADVASMMLGGMTLGIGVDFAIHFLNRYRLLRSGGTSHLDAVTATASSTGRALLVNALVLTGGFLVMLGARFYPQMKLGGLIAVTMTVCFISTLWLFPALLGSSRDD